MKQSIYGQLRMSHTPGVIGVSLHECEAIEIQMGITVFKNVAFVFPAHEIDRSVITEVVDGDFEVHFEEPVTVYADFYLHNRTLVELFLKGEVNIDGSSDYVTIGVNSIDSNESDSVVLNHQLFAINRLFRNESNASMYLQC